MPYAAVMNKPPETIAEVLESLKDATVTLTVSGVPDSTLQGVRIEAVRKDHLIIASNTYTGSVYIPFASIGTIRKS